MKETVHHLKSAHLGNERTIWLRESNRLDQPGGLTIFLDAEIYRDHVHASAVIDELEARNAIAPSAFVFVSAQSEAARWRECPCHPPFARFVLDKLLPWIETQRPSPPLAGPRVLVGLSYTGLAAAYIAVEAPGAFDRVIAQSGSFWSNDCWLTKELERKPRPSATSFYLDVGTKETMENVRHTDDVFQVTSQIDGVRRFRDALVGNGQKVKYVEFEGGHQTDAWNLTLPGALRWALPPSLAGRLVFAPVTTADFDPLVELRTAAMRESLERVGRFDPARARERLKNSFFPEHTQFVLWDGSRIGFYTLRPMGRYLQLDHLYVHPTHQSRGIGSQVLRSLLQRADALSQPVHVGALKQSAANGFYRRHGFVQQSEEAWDIYYVRPPQPGTAS